MEQPAPNLSANQHISTNLVDINDVFAFTKQAWRANGIFILKNMIPIFIPLALLHYFISALPIVVAAFPVFGWIAGWMLSIILIPLGFILALLLQSVVFGMNHPIKNVILHGKQGVPPNQSFFSLARQNLGKLLLLSLLTSIATTIGACMLIIPGIIIAILAQPTAYLVATRGLGLEDAVRKAIEVIKANPIPIFAYHAIFALIGVAIVIPCAILTFGLGIGISYVSPLLGELIMSALYPTLYLTVIPVFSFVIGTLYVKLIDDNQPAALPDITQPPAQSW